MAERNTGFRFDIYERVLLPEGTPAIGNLEEIELLPYVQQVPGQEHTLLRGHLQLTAVYEPGEQGIDKQTFIHRIPVEISLPVRGNNRENEDIAVHIDQFDVELVSNRSLNVTGVLSLAGWEQAPSEAHEQHGEEEFVVVHEAGSTNDSEKEATQRLESELMKQAKVPPAEAAVEEFAMKIAEQPQEIVTQELPTMDSGLAGTKEEDEVKHELKVAFNPIQQTIQEEVTDSSESDKPEKANNSLQWKSLFLSKDEEAKFKKMRLCIVQKEETIQTIAEKYQMNPREIALYNRLGESDVNEGQIIYIPNK